MEARAAQPPPPRFYKLYAGGADAGPPPPEAIAGGEFQQYGTSYSLGEQGGEGDAATLSLSPPACPPFPLPPLSPSLSSLPLSSRPPTLTYYSNLPVTVLSMWCNLCGAVYVVLVAKINMV